MGLGILRRDFLHTLSNQEFSSCHVNKWRLGHPRCPIGRCCQCPLGPAFRQFPERRRDDQKCCCSVSWKVGHYPSIAVSAPIARKRPSFVSLRSVLILLSRIMSRIQTQIHARLWSLLFVSLTTSCSLFCLLTSSLMVDENLVRISIFW